MISGSVSRPTPSSGLGKTAVVGARSQHPGRVEGCRPDATPACRFCDVPAVALRASARQIYSSACTRTAGASRNSRPIRYCGSPLEGVTRWRWRILAASLTSCPSIVNLIDCVVSTAAATGDRISAPVRLIFINVAGRSTSRVPHRDPTTSRRIRRRRSPSGLMPPAAPRVSRSVVTGVVSRPLTRFFRQRIHGRFAWLARGCADDDTSQRHTIPFQQLPHTHDERGCLIAGGVVQQHAHFTFAEAADKVTSAQVLADAHGPLLRHVGTKRRISKGDDQSRYGDAVLYSIADGTFKYFVETASRRTAIARARLTHEASHPRFEQIGRSIGHVAFLLRDVM